MILAHPCAATSTFEARHLLAFDHLPALNSALRRWNGHYPSLHVVDASISRSYLAPINLTVLVVAERIAAVTSER